MSERHIAFQKFQSLLQTDELASLGPEPRLNRDSVQILEGKLCQNFAETKLTESAQPLIRSLVLLWHDHLDKSHSISQEIHNADGSFLHGIMHRREPDYGNAKYWFHRAGEHPCFPEIAARVTRFLDDANENNLKTKLVRDGGWDALAFVDAGEDALAKRAEKTISVLRKIQEIECNTLLEYFLR